MIKVLRIVGFFLLLLMILILILGIYSPSKIVIEHTHLLQAPHTQVWQLITDPEKTLLWLTQIKNIQIEKDIEFKEESLLCYYLKPAHYIAFSLKEIKVSDSLNYKLIGHQKNPVIRNYNIIVKLKSLRDGSTEINCKITYEIKNIVGKISNKLYFERNQKNILEHTLSSLKKYLEKV